MSGQSTDELASILFIQAAADFLSADVSRIEGLPRTEVTPLCRITALSPSVAHRTRRIQDAAERAYRLEGWRGDLIVSMVSAAEGEMTYNEAKEALADLIAKKAQPVSAIDKARKRLRGLS